MIPFLLPVAAAAALGAAAAAPVARPLVSISATPAHMTLIRGVPQRLVVHNDGAVRVTVLARPKPFSFDLYGNAAIAPPQVPARSSHAWLVVRPRRLVLEPGAAGTIRIAARLPRRTSAGDHHALVLLSTLAPGRARVSVRTRLGVLVLVRTRGRLVRQLAIRRVWLARGRGWRTIVVAATNRGNVAERLLAGQVTVGLRRRGRLIATLRTLPRDLLPRTSGYIFAPVGRALRGRFTAVVHVAAEPATAYPRTPPLPGVTKTTRLRL